MNTVDLHKIATNGFEVKKHRDNDADTLAHPDWNYFFQVRNVGDSDILYMGLDYPSTDWPYRVLVYEADTATLEGLLKSIVAFVPNAMVAMKLLTNMLGTGEYIVGGAPPEILAR